MNRKVVGLIGLCSLAACERVENTYNSSAPQLDTRLYCNDPDAVNYNWNFPGKPDNSVCLYPADLFKGTFLFKDTVTREDGTIDSIPSTQQYLLTISGTDKNRLRISGFCAQTLTLTAPRTGFRATLDTTVEKGQLFCRPVDTVSGTLRRELSDSVGIRVAFTVLSDSGTRYHQGTATRQ